MPQVNVADVPVAVARAVWWLKIRSWEKWQGEGIYDRIRKRKAAGRGKPLVLAYVAVASNLNDQSGNFARFSASVGGGIKARGYLVALLGYAGRNSATTGVLRVTRDRFGPVVLTDELDTVGRKSGEWIWDRLVESGICATVSPESVVEITPPPARTKGGDASGEDGGEYGPEDDGEKGGRRGEERRREDSNDSPPPPPGADGERLSFVEEASWNAARPLVLGGAAGDVWAGWAKLLPAEPPPEAIRSALSRLCAVEEVRKAVLGAQKAAGRMERSRNRQRRPA